MATYTLELSQESTDELNRLASQTNSSPADLLQHKAEQWMAWEREALAAHREGLRDIEAGRSFSSEEVREKLDAAIRARRVA
jgi:predicted transcriptional regulator